MTVTAISTETTYALNGATLGPFNTVWPYRVASDVTVELDIGDGNGARLLTQGADYTLTAFNPTLTNGGQVMLAAHLLTTPAWAPLAQVALARFTPRSQPSAYGEQVGFSPQSSEQALDNVERQVQELTTEFTRALVVEQGQPPPRPLVLNPDSILITDDDAAVVCFEYGEESLKLLGTAQGELRWFDPPAPLAPPYPVGASNVITAPSYDSIRQSGYVPAGSPAAILLVSGDRSGIFVQSPGTMTDNGGTVLVDMLGQRWVRIVDRRVNAGWFFNAPSGAFGDGLGEGITAADLAANPQWIGLPSGGAYPVGTTWDYVALQETLYACFASASTPGHVVWNGNSVTLNRPMFVPPGNFRINQGLVLVASGVDIEFAERRGSQITYIGPLNITPLTFDSISYGKISNLGLTDGTEGVTGQLIDMNHTGAYPGLATQQLTFYDWAVGGVSLVDQVGIYISRAGGSAQGDTITFINPLVLGCMQGLVAGGPNALSITIIDGDFQSCWKDAIATGGGTIFCYGTSFQNQGASYFSYPQQNQVTLGGADFHVYGGSGGTARNKLDAVRSESNVLMTDVSANTGMRDCGIGPGFGGWSAGVQYHLGMAIDTQDPVNGTVILVDDGGPQWFVAQPGSTVNKAIAPGAPGWAANQWVGKKGWFRYGNGYCVAFNVTASDANSFTPDAPFPIDPTTYLVHVGGFTGSTIPGWATAPAAHVTPVNQTGQAFQTTAGSNAVQIGSTILSYGIAVGWYVVITGAKLIQAPVPLGAPCRGPMIGKIGSMDTPSGGATMIHIVDPLGQPVNADFTISDALGYFGPGFADGGLTWMVLDFNVVLGVSDASNCYFGVGRCELCRHMQLQQPVPPNFFREYPPPSTDLALLTWDNGNRAVQAATAINANQSPINIAVGQVTDLPEVRLDLGITPLVVNLPLLSVAICVSMIFVLHNGTAVPITVNWGTNVIAGSSTTVPATSGKVVTLTWAGDMLRGGSGIWYVH
jgi:hypothetical protein